MPGALFFLERCVSADVEHSSGAPAASRSRARLGVALAGFSWRVQAMACGAAGTGSIEPAACCGADAGRLRGTGGCARRDGRRLRGRLRLRGRRQAGLRRLRRAAPSPIRAARSHRRPASHRDRTGANTAPRRMHKVRDAASADAPIGSTITTCARCASITTRSGCRNSRPRAGNRPDRCAPAHRPARAPLAHDLGHVSGGIGPIGAIGRGMYCADAGALAATNPAASQGDELHRSLPVHSPWLTSSMNGAELGRRSGAMMRVRRSYERTMARNLSTSSLRRLERGDEPHQHSDPSARRLRQARLHG